MPANSKSAPSTGVVVVLVAAACVAVGLAITYQPIAVIALLGLAVLGLAAVRPYAVSIVLIACGFSLEWLVSLKVIPAASTLLMDALALSLVFAAVGHLVRQDRPRGIPRGFLWLLGAVAASIVGLAFSGSDVVVAALSMRTLLRFTPLIFLPAIFGWSDKRLRTLVWLILGLSIAQTPVALWQFFVRTSTSGDTVGGTLGSNTSGTLTTFVIAMVTLVAGLYIYRAARGLPLVVVMLLECIPPALNETKVFFIAAPLV
jgi:hypothetical protein